MLALDPQTLEEAAGRIGAVAAALTCLDAAGPLHRVREVLPGSAAGAAALRAATALDAAVDAWAAHLVDLAETARLVARDLQATDTAVAGTFRTGAP